ncbi:MAG: hypothetical protein HPY64_14715 [Anaerolineae bacterium]|nr:hypothetical protein [Anaerolineae bacterium]
MSDKRMSAREVRQTARLLEKSLKSTADGLDMLLKSLERGGLGAAVGPYQQLGRVLIQQRLWALDYRRDELKPLWKAIAAKAAAIHALLAPFAAVMGELKDIDRITAGGSVAEAPAPAPPPAPDALTGQVIDLLVAELAVSGVRLAGALDCLPEERRQRLRRLAQAGMLEEHGWGRGRSYRLTPAARQALAERLAALLPPDEGGGGR